MSQISPTGASLSAQISIVVADKAQDVTKFQGEAAVALLEQAAQLQQQITNSNDPHRGRVLDIIG